MSRHDSGVYFCLASNGVPPTVSKKVRLYVDCKTNEEIRDYYTSLEMIAVIQFRNRCENFNWLENFEPNMTKDISSQIVKKTALSLQFTTYNVVHMDHALQNTSLAA